MTTNPPSCLAGRWGSHSFACLLASQAEAVDISRLALELVQTDVPLHLIGDTSLLAIFGSRVFATLGIQQVYRQMSLLLHPDKRPAGASDLREFTDAFLKLGSLYEEVSALTPTARIRAKSAPWRYPAEEALLRAIRLSQQLPPPPEAPSPPAAPSSASPEPVAVWHFMEHINLEATRLAQNLLATHFPCGSEVMLGRVGPR